MKKIILLLPAVFFVIFNVVAQPPKLSAGKGAHFGETVKAVDAVPPDALPALLKENLSAAVNVKGVVVDVCQAKGCFMYMKTATGKIYIKTKDDAFFVPLALNGKTVVVKGTASKNKEKNEISIQATGVLVI
jgi:Domain of unknown function (DUF4920)